ncbi:hypothetical protein Tco_0148860 [Tanacetum coccineum]
MLYDEFDKFTSEPGESIHSYYLRYAKLINDMNMIPMSMSNMQINTKFVNHLQLEWSRFVIAVKQVINLHVLNFDQLYAFLKHNEKDANEVQEMRQRFPCSLALLANTYNPPPSYNITQQLIQSPPKQSYAPPVVPQQLPILPTQPDSGFIIPTFLPTDDPIEFLNKAMIFLSFTYSSRFPPTNNKLRTTSNPRTQATIQNGQVLVQNVQGRQSQGYARNARKSQATRAKVINTVGDARANQPRVIRCYNYRGEGHIAKQCTTKKRVKVVEWFKDKMLLPQAQEACVVLNEEQQDFLADKLEENDDCDDLQLHTTTNFKVSHVDAYNFDCDDQAIASAIFMASLSFAGSLNDDTVVQETEYNEHFVSHDDSYAELTSDSNVISYAEYMVTIQDEDDHYVPPPAQNKDMMLSVIDQMKSQVDHCIIINQEAKSVNESLSTELEK